MWINSPLYGKSHAMGPHSVTCHSTAVTFPPLLQPKLVLDWATPEKMQGWVDLVLISQDSLSDKNRHHSNALFKGVKRSGSLLWDWRCEMVIITPPICIHCLGIVPQNNVSRLSKKPPTDADTVGPTLRGEWTLPPGTRVAITHENPLQVRPISKHLNDNLLHMFSACHKWIYNVN